MEKKTNFFKKVWYSITKFDKYPEMAAEGIGKAIKYLMILTIILTLVSVINSLKEMNKLVYDLSLYIEKEIPEFSYSNNKIIMENEEPIIISEIQNPVIDKIVISAKTETEEQKDTIKMENEINGNMIYFFKNQIILRTKTENNNVQESEYTYSDIMDVFLKEEIKDFNKSELIEFMRSNKMNLFYSRFALTMLLCLFIINFLVILSDVLLLALLGVITTVTARIRMKFMALYNMAAYSITLSLILNIIYIIINCFTDFIITYFQIAYITIAYIYLAAAIFILKEDFMKKQEELTRIQEEQLKVRAEIQQEEKEKQKEDEEDKEDEEKNNDKNKQEPKGSEA